MQYVMATAVLDPRLTLDSFRDDAVLRPEAQALMGRYPLSRIQEFETR